MDNENDVEEPGRMRTRGTDVGLNQEPAASVLRVSQRSGALAACLPVLGSPRGLGRWLQACLSSGVSPRSGTLAACLPVSLSPTICFNPQQR